jgi:hypothetical protein
MTLYFVLLFPGLFLIGFITARFVDFWFWYGDEIKRDLRAWFKRKTGR